MTKITKIRLAVFIIAASGVAIAVGLQGTASNLTITKEQYFEEQNIYDLKISSDTSLSYSDLDELKAIEGIAEIEGNIKRNEAFIKAAAIPQKINTLELLEGVYPQTKSECVIDSSMLRAKIGDSIKVDGKEFHFDSYTVVGIVQSPLSIEKESENTIYFMEEAFTNHSFKEAYITLNKADNKEQQINEIQEEIETVLQNIYEGSKTKAMQAVNEAEDEVATLEVERDAAMGNQNKPILARQKALGKIELKIDQDEVNGFSAVDIAARRAAIAPEKEAITKELGAFNNQYNEWQDKILLAKDNVVMAQENLDAIEKPIITVEARIHKEGFTKINESLEEANQTLRVSTFTVLFITAAVLLGYAFLMQRGNRKLSLAKLIPLPLIGGSAIGYLTGAMLFPHFMWKVFQDEFYFIRDIKTEIIMPTETLVFTAIILLLVGIAYFLGNRNVFLPQRQ